MTPIESEEFPRIHKLLRLSIETGSWSSMIADWTQQAKDCGENIEDYSPGILQELESCCSENNNSSGTFGLIDISDNKHDIVCQLNWTFLPGYQGKVLRLRHLTISPNIDAQATNKNYEDILISLLTEVEIFARRTEINCEHIKFHLRSPADQTFFRRLSADLSTEKLSTGKLYRNVDIRGAWLYISL